ncbi:HupE/UreJ family protein [Flavobacterium psychrotolerans]|uniref:HupE / UreJ protein n=1 Tax=Flavobacterium psychrotolerans TaxID=2169410 RepID=A0A2U1JKY8_9FLAO|nr:HupE/UreJ family protein [Flavobacterium psychrotolerans]PWA05543.1 HupE / UreJ protein [Flavobacterium psychrotolerans]
MSEFLTYFQLAWGHVLDIKGFDHVLFLIALALPYGFKDWKRLLLLVTIFTIGQTLALLLSFFGIVIIKLLLVEFLIPITILITALFNLFSVGKSYKGNSINLIGIVTLFFGIIHGLEFSIYFKSIIKGSLSDKIKPLFEFALGIEVAQILIVLVVLIFSYILQNFFRFSKRDFTLVFSSFVIGVVLPIIIESAIWN